MVLAGQMLRPPITSSNGRTPSTPPPIPHAADHALPLLLRRPLPPLPRPPRVLRTANLPLLLQTLPFLSSCVVLPASIAFFMLYGKLLEVVPQQLVFYAAISPLVAFYLAFTGTPAMLLLLLHPWWPLLLRPWWLLLLHPSLPSTLPSWVGLLCCRCTPGACCLVVRSRPAPLLSLPR